MSKALYRSALIALSLTFALPTYPVNKEQIKNPHGQWLSHGRDYHEQRFSPLEQINQQNVAQLGLTWSFTFDTARAMQATPLMHNGVLYVTTAWSQVYAINARTGEQLWQFDAGVDKAHLIKTCCGPNNRGVALWQADSLNLYVGTLDGRLLALNAQTGTVVWSVQTTPTDGNYSITGAPRVINGKVIIGNGGADLGARGFVSAYSATTGELLWRFYTVPGDPNKAQENTALENAVNTWTGDYWYQQGGGGGTVWDALAYDPELNLLYIGTGNGSPWNRKIRSPEGGDNLYLSSIVALNADSGEYVWHYQTTPAENWDYTASQHMILAELSIDGVRRSVIMQAPKNGFFYVLDRATGELLSAEPYTRTTWASHVDIKTGRPVETDYADYQTNGATILWPSPFGGHNWQPMSFNPGTGLVYIPVQNIPGFYAAVESVDYRVGRWNIGVDLYENRDPVDWVIAKAVRDALVSGELLAWDPVKQQRVWRVRHKTPSNGGVLSTAGGLVFQGTGSGEFLAYRAQSGQPLWRYQSDSAILAGPISYELDGEQYIAVAQGSGGAVMLALGDTVQTQAPNYNRLLVFKLGASGQNKPPVSTPRAITVIEAGSAVDQQIVKQGAKLYERNCAVCHGVSLNASQVVPDLRYMSEQTHREFVAITLGGSRKHLGMVGFYETLDLHDVNAIQAYIDHEKRQLTDRQTMSVWQKVKYWTVYWSTRAGAHFPPLMNAARPYLLEE